MFLYPALTIGFLFVAVPLLVHLINMLRHRRQKWAAMDFLLASYRKQKKWIRLRQLLLLLSRLAVAAVLIAMLCGWTGGGRMLGVLGGSTTHHVVILDDSYSMGDSSGGTSAYARSLQALQDLTRRLATDDRNHQLTVMRSSRAALVVRGGSDSGDSAADLSAQTITSDARLINRIMSTSNSSVQTDLVAALDLAAELVRSTPADQKILYIASDFRQRDWASPQRISESLRRISGDDCSIQLIDCAANPVSNLAVTELTPVQDVWVAGVPVVVRATIRNYGPTDVRNVSVGVRIYQYPSDLVLPDPTRAVTGKVESLPAMVIDSLAAGAEITKTFQVYVAEPGTHAVEVSLPDDSLDIDNSRFCTLPLSDAEKVLVIDGNADGRGAYHVAAVLDPGSQVRVGAIPETQPPSFLRGATLESLTAYRAVYLIDLPEMSENVADLLDRYVRRGGGIAWFLGPNVSRDSYNRHLLSSGRALLPMPLGEISPLADSVEPSAADIEFGDAAELIAPLRAGGDAALSLIGLTQSWTLQQPELAESQVSGVSDIGNPLSGSEANNSVQADAPRVRVVLRRRDGQPLVTQHEVDQGRIITVMTGLDGSWTNWPGDPTFVVFLLQSNAELWSGAAPQTRRLVDEPLVRRFSLAAYAPQSVYLPATKDPPRVPIELVAEAQSDAADADPFGLVASLTLDPKEMAIEGEANVNDLLRPGLSEWALTRNDGRGEIIPVASVIRIGEGDLKRADPASIQQELLPVEVKFLTSQAWSLENQTAGSSTLALLLLGLLGTLLAGEQALAYWASYHGSGSASVRTARKPLFVHSGPFSVRDSR